MPSPSSVANRESWHARSICRDADTGKCLIRVGIGLQLTGRVRPEADGLFPRRKGHTLRSVHSAFPIVAHAASAETALATTTLPP